MIKSTRSKRRKIRNELNIYKKINSSSSTSNIELLNASNEIEQKEIECSVNDTGSLLSVVSEDSSNFISINKTIDTLPDIFISEETSAPLSPLVLNTSNHSMSDISISTFLADWAIRFNIPHNTFNGLLRGLKEHKCFNHLPVDCRTLLKTPSNSSSLIRNVEPGLYYHFSLTKGLQMHASSNLSTIQIAIGIDGLPLSKSSNSQFWPILAYIVNDPSLKKTVFPIGLYHGNKKPSNSNEFLFDFVEEMKSILSANGVFLNKKKVNVSIHYICCDAPAKSFILKVKGHTGFFSCTRCTIEGEHVNRRTCFPYSQSKSTEKTHLDYINASDEDYHTNCDNISNLSELENLDLVKSFPLDYMHLVCLGVMKKLLMLWVQKGPLKVRLRSSKITEFSSLLLSLNSCITSDFARKHRTLQDLCRWKATEFRFFLLYSGPVVLKNIISEECYNNFMALSIAMLILLSPDLGFLVDYARELLDFFVHSFQSIYGLQYVSHNVHGLLHLHDDYKLYGPLDNCSAFKFENHMKTLKSYLRKHEKPLLQVMNRYHEIETVQLISNLQVKSDEPLFKTEHNNGPLLNEITGTVK